ncbi:MAG: asparagine synthase-related protein [Phycisphaeraceae bacterium]
MQYIAAPSNAERDSLRIKDLLLAYENESLFLAFRRFFPLPQREILRVANEQQIIDFIGEQFRTSGGRVGILLSSGVDSAILAHFLPEGSIAYTMDYEGSYQKHSEFAGAAQFVPAGVVHKRVIIEREAYFAAIDELTLGRKAPTVPHEAAVYLAARQAKKDGVEVLAAGFGADGRLGGFPGLYKHTAPDAFKRQLFSLYVDPSRVLNEPAPIDWVFDQYTVDGQIDVKRFLTEVGTEGNSAREAIELAGLAPLTPYTQLAYAGDFDPSREPKYLLHHAFELLYGHPPPYGESALWVPYDDWFGGIQITRPEFQPGCVISKPVFMGQPRGVFRFLNRTARRTWREINNRLSKKKYFPGKQGYLLYSLARYFHFKAQEGWVTPDPRG